MALDRARARAELIRLAKAGPGRVRGPLGRATRRFRGAFSGPLVTVVLPVSAIWPGRALRYRPAQLRTCASRRSVS